MLYVMCGRVIETGIMNMGREMFWFCIVTSSLSVASSIECPRGWEPVLESCYKFTRAPLKDLKGAKEKCFAYNAHLVSVNTIEEHSYIVNYLSLNDPQHRRWFTSGQDEGNNVWVWDGDQTQFTNVDALWLPDQEKEVGKYLAYNYSKKTNSWGLAKVSSTEELAYICEVHQEDVNEIVIMDRNIDYGIIVNDKRKLPKGPSFLQEPEDGVFDLSGRNQVNYISLRCVAGGYPPPTYTWYKEEYERDNLVNRNIDPLSDYRYTQTDGILIISNPNQTKDRGKYHCSATNKFGTVISQTVHLSFGFIGEFNKKRSPDYGREYWGKSITCDPPQHYPEVNYYWTRNTFPNFVEEDQRVFVSRDGNLYFSNLEKIDRANYSCNVQSVISSTGRTGPFFSLRVEPASSGQKLLFPNTFPKSFPEAPLAGQNVRLECVAYGYPVPFYNWTRDGSSRSLPQGSYMINYNRVLIIPNIRVEDMGDYICVASSGIESIQKAVSLSIQARPQFTINLDDKVMDTGSTLTWTCEAFGIPDVTYSWWKNGQKLLIDQLMPSDITRYHIFENVLTIENLIAERDEGMYQCKATNQLGSTYSTGQLRIITLSPTFEKYPLEKETYAGEGGNVTIPCRPEAAPKPKFTWMHNGVVLSGSGRIQLIDNGYLYITSVQRGDEGQYTCTAKNPLGSDKSSGNLIVLPKPRLLESPLPKVVAQVNESIELSCEAYVSDILDLAYIWLHNELRIDFKERPSITVGSQPGILRIHNISLADAGIYHCLAKTSVGQIMSPTELLVTGPPGAPGAVLVEGLTATSGWIQWADGSSNGRRILTYSVEGKTNHDSAWVELASNITTWKRLQGSDRKEYHMKDGLSPWSTYEFRVLATNELGKGPPSLPSPQYNTKMDKPHVAPTGVGGGGGNTGSLTITWHPLPPQQWNAPQIWYKVYYKPADSDIEYRIKDLKELGNIGLYAVQVGEENFYKPYHVKVQAINSQGAGPISPEVEVYSAESMPQVQPSQVKALPFNSTALNVSWAPIDYTREKIRGKLIGYRIKYWKENENPQRDSLTLLKRGQESWGLIVGLQPDMKYYVAVMAYNDAGSGTESEPFLARTFKAAPLQPPTSVKVRAISPTSVLVTWRGVIPSSVEEPIQGYKVVYWEADQDFTTNKQVFRYLDGLDLVAVVSGLVPGKVYKLRVMAFSLGGDGKMSSPPWEFRVGEGVVSAYTSSSQNLSFSVTSLFLVTVVLYSFNSSK
ncbi:contactin isoform X1 [Tachypleus tridentatus]|uniref:contactin isoform X1 n=2 Tax=Tachypleus tridentatus TaxID=6853 RepID=UPI003FD4EC62